MAETPKTLELPQYLVDRLERHAEFLSASSPGLSLSWQDAAALILIRGLSEFGPEADQEPGPELNG
jgi:hypothetical protein